MIVDYHKRELDLLLNSYENIFPHSWIFEGTDSTGKKKVFEKFIKQVFKGKSNYLQYIHEVNGGSDIALIDDIRRLIKQSSLTNSQGLGLKTFFVIHNAESLNFNCFNALLKTIEEPPANTAIIIMTCNLKKIPKTIISRCVILRFNPYNSSSYASIKELEKNLDESLNFQISNYNPIVFDILKTSDGKKILDITLEIMKKNHMNISDIDKLFLNVSKNLENYFSLVKNIFFNYLKEKFINNFDNTKKSKTILVLLNNIQNVLNPSVNLDKKKILYFMFSEFFKFKINE